jgi:VWFA-related protein
MKFARVLIAVAAILLWTQCVLAQDPCLTPDGVKSLLTQFSSPQQKVSRNKKLRAKLLELQEQNQNLVRDIAAASSQEKSLKRVTEARENNGAQLCKVIKEYGWPAASLVDRDGVSAALFLLQNSASFQFQVDLLPVIVAATKQGDVEKSDFADFIDRLRVRAGQTQLFGSQAVLVNGLLVLYPISDEAHVNDRRKQYGLPPLAESMRDLESLYQTPLIRSPVVAPSADKASEAEIARIRTSLGADQTGDGDDVIRVDTNLVSLNVSVYSNKLKTYVSDLEQKDFKVIENGHQEDLTFFAKTDVPFDLVLLIDISGSTSGMRDLIRQSTQRFIEAARPSDRIAIVTFSEVVNVVTPLTADRPTLLQSIDQIEGSGGTKLWDALKFTIDQVVGPKTTERRRAIVLMSDGGDNALVYGGQAGSRISFADLVEAIRHNDTLVVPIFLNIGDGTPLGAGMFPQRSRIYQNARRTMTLFAEESGGLYYSARKIEDLNGVYEQVIDDLGKVYSLGYKPANEKRDGTWRRVEIKIPNRPDLAARARPGYYAN